MSSVLNEIVDILVGGLTSMSTGIASGLNNMAKSLFIDNTGTTPALTAFGGIVAIFGGIALRSLDLQHLLQNGLCHLVAETNPMYEESYPSDMAFLLLGVYYGKLKRLTDLFISEFDSRCLHQFVNKLFRKVVYKLWQYFCLLFLYV